MILPPHPCELGFLWLAHARLDCGLNSSKAIWQWATLLPVSSAR